MGNSCEMELVTTIFFSLGAGRKICPVNAYRILDAWFQMAHGSTKAGNHRTVCGDVLDEIAVGLSDHDILVQLRAGVIENLRRTFPAVKDFLLLV